MGPVLVPETLVHNYFLTLPNIQENRKFHSYRGVNLKPCYELLIKVLCGFT